MSSTFSCLNVKMLAVSMPSMFYSLEVFTLSSGQRPREVSVFKNL